MPAHSSGSPSSDGTYMSRAERRAVAKGRALPPSRGGGKVQDAGRKTAAPRQWANRRRG